MTVSTTTPVSSRELDYQLFEYLIPELPDLDYKRSEYSTPEVKIDWPDASQWPKLKEYLYLEGKRKIQQKKVKFHC